MFRQGYGGNRANYLDFYVGDTISRNRWTLDLGVRFDRQDGEALPSETLPNAAFPTVVPGVVFAGYKTPFTWNNFSPRAGVTYALDELTQDGGARELHAVRGAAQHRHRRRPQPELDGRFGDVSLGRSERAITSRRRTKFYLDQRITSAGGFNPANPTAVTSANVLDPNLKAPVTSSVVAGIDRELIPNLAVGVNYSYTRTYRLFGNFTGTITPRVGVTLADYTPGSGFSGTIPLDGGVAYNVPTYIPNPAAIAAGGNGFVTTNVPGYLHRLPRHRDDAEQAAVEPVDGPRRRVA